MITLKRTNSDNSDFQKLVIELDKDLKVRDGDDHPFFAQYNKIDAIKYVVVAYKENIPVACGAIKQYDENIMEVKRMYVPLELRGKGIASIVLKELETWSKELNFFHLILETGEKMPEAIQLYKKNDYKIIPNYGQYAGVKTSRCFEKHLS